MVASSPQTFGTRLADARGMPEGFDALRIVLALMIAYWHAGGILGAHGGQAIDALLQPVAPIVQDGFRTPLRAVVAACVPMFFALSGFLVAASAERNSVRIFLSLRVIRILPALMVEVCISALVIGPLLTTYDLGRYVSDPLFAAYFANILGQVQLFLPGLFEGNPVPRIVNANLWTLPAEFYCYIALTAIMMLRLFPNTAFLAAAFAASTVALLVANLWYGQSVLNEEQFRILPLVYIFLCGCIAYKLRHRLRASVPLLCLALAASFLTLWARKFVMLSPLPLTYATVYLGTMRFRLPAFLRRNDYSYGVYLYGFPISQCVAATAPWLTGYRFLGRMVCLALTIAFAALSWHLVEKRCLRLKARIKAMPAAQRVALAADPTAPSSR
ncbi:acyltransferase family protein [Methylobacterium sp. A54F]